MHLQTHAVAGAVDEVFAQPRILDHAARGAIKFAHGHAGAHRRATRFIRGAADLVHALLFVGRMAEEHRARHIGNIAVVQKPHIDDHAVAGLDAGSIVIVVRLRAVRAEAGDRRKAVARAAHGLGVLRVQILQFNFGDALMNACDRAARGFIVHVGRLAQNGDFLRILAHARIVHRTRAQHRLHIAPRVHQANGELARPDLIYAQLAALHRFGKRRDRIIRIVEFNQFHAGFRRLRKQAVCKQLYIAVLI